MTDPDVVVWGHDEQWHLVNRYNDYTLCGMGRGSPLHYRDDHKTACLECIDRQARGFPNAPASAYASTLNI